MKINLFEIIVWGMPLICIYIFYVAGRLLSKNGSMLVDLATLFVLSFPLAFLMMIIEVKVMVLCADIGVYDDIGIIKRLWIPFFAIPLYLLAAFKAMRNEEIKKQS